MKRVMFLFAFALVLAPLSSAQASARAGDLIKCADFSAVYYLADDGQRYVFPNEKIYFSWYEDFSTVKEISCGDLGDLALGGNIAYQAGSRLVKIQSVPTVYAVENGGLLRAIASEEQAQTLYGDAWAGLVDDIPDAFFGAYTIGEELAEGELPQGYDGEDVWTYPVLIADAEGVNFDPILEVGEEEQEQETESEEDTGGASTVEFAVVADESAFDPSSITVSSGDTVRITFTFNDDNSYFGGLDIKSDYFETVQYRESSGSESKTVEFTAQESFTIRSYWPSSGVFKTSMEVVVE